MIRTNPRASNLAGKWWVGRSAKRIDKGGMTNYIGQGKRAGRSYKTHVNKNPKKIKGAKYSGWYSTFRSKNGKRTSKSTDVGDGTSDRRRSADAAEAVTNH